MPNLPDIADINELGGILTNYWPVEDPTTDIDASADNKSRANVAMMSATAPRGWVRFTSAATTGAMVLVAHNAVWGTGGPVAPALAHLATGQLTLTFPTTVTDPLAVVHTVNIRAATANSRGGATAYFRDAVPTAANVITLYVFNAAGAANDAVGVDFDVFYW